MKRYVLTIDVEPESDEAFASVVTDAINVPGFLGYSATMVGAAIVDIPTPVSTLTDMRENAEAEGEQPA